MRRKILHLDLDAFFCSVEERYRPELKGKAFAVGARPEERGVVASCSYPARMCGVRSAMPMRRAIQLCPHLIVVPARHGVYSEISREVMVHLHALSPLVEKVSIDEAFVDVSDLPEPGENLAHALQKTIWECCALPCSIGVATNKLMAKIANDVGKAAQRSGSPPNAITVVPAGEEAAFLAPLPVEALWGIGPKTNVRLAELGIRTIGELARWPVPDLIRRFGKHGEDMAQHARGIDERSIVTESEAKSISQETTFVQDVRDQTTLKRTLQSLVEKVGRRLRQAELAGSTIRIKLRWADFTTLTRQVTLEEATNQDEDIFNAAWRLFQQIWTTGKPVRLIGVGVSGLKPPVRQLTLWETGSEKGRRLQAAIDDLRQRYGPETIQRGRADGPPGERKHSLDDD
jgi:DNA polymerase IV